jgi:phosphohistidine phosphatase SixA
MLHKFNQKKIFLALLVLLLSASLTTLILQKFNKNYSLVKINEKKIEDEKISSEIIEYLKLKNIETDLNKSILEQIYWVERIKDGGLILLFRHSEREKWSNSVEAFDIYELTNKYNARNFSWDKATCLTQRGIEESKLINKAFKHAKIKISKVISSPSCRAAETAIFAFDKIDEIFSGLLHYTAFHPLDRKKIGASLKKEVLNLEITDNENIILSAHNKVISHENFIDEMIASEGLNESGFYIIEKKNNKLVVPFKFSTIKNFIILLYRHEFEKTLYNQ